MAGRPLIGSKTNDKKVSRLLVIQAPDYRQRSCLRKRFNPARPSSLLKKIKRKDNEK